VLAARGAADAPDQARAERQMNLRTAVALLP
jgi:hypothetical protein